MADRFRDTGDDSFRDTDDDQWHFEPEPAEATPTVDVEIEKRRRRFFGGSRAIIRKQKRIIRDDQELLELIMLFMRVLKWQT